MHVATSPRRLRSESNTTSNTTQGMWHSVFVFLLAVDVVVLFIYLLLLPKDNWESLDVRLKAIGSLAASIVTYFGLKTALQKRAANALKLIDSTSFRAILLFITLILWSSILPIWSYRFVFNPPQTFPPTVKIASRSLHLAYLAKQSVESGPRTAELDGLLLRSYDLKFAGSKESYYLPAVSILKGTLLHRPIEVQLPCMVQLPIVSGATVFYRRYGEAAEDDKKAKDPEYGPLPDDGKIFLMPGHYDYIRVETNADVGSAAAEVKCSAQDVTGNDLTAAINMKPQ